jgi:hypothetical protein
MKNIHVLPTDKPSRLHLWTDENGTRPALCELEYSHTRNTQNIYITSSDEEIKEGEWCFDGSYLIQATPKLVDAQGLFDRRDWRKIILTTDQDLIKDGVQAIDDEFLEWFVKNPSCEFVKVSKIYNSYGEIDIFDLVCTPHSFKYKTIIPKEEQVLIQSSIDGDVIWSDKQETLEDLLNKKAKQSSRADLDAYANGLDDGANWQAERMYSKEEVEHLIHLAVFQSHCGVKDRVKIPNSNECAGFVNKWFEQFKKK